MPTPWRKALLRRLACENADHFDFGLCYRFGVLQIEGVDSAIGVMDLGKSASWRPNMTGTPIRWYNRRKLRRVLVEHGMRNNMPRFMVGCNFPLHWLTVQAPWSPEFMAKRFCCAEEPLPNGHK
jgi:hypothetical protein